MKNFIVSITALFIGLFTVLLGIVMIIPVTVTALLLGQRQSATRSRNPMHSAAHPHANSSSHSGSSSSSHTIEGEYNDVSEK